MSIPPFPLHVRPQQPSPPATPSPKVTVPTLVPEKSSPVPTPTQIEEDDDSEVTVTPEDYQMLFTVEFYVSKRQQNDISPRLFIIYANELREYDGITGCFLELYNLDHLVSVRIIPDLKSFLEIDLKDQMLILEVFLLSFRSPSLGILLLHFRVVPPPPGSSLYQWPLKNQSNLLCLSTNPLLLEQQALCVRLWLPNAATLSKEE